MALALVTGARRGIGLEVVRQLASQGHSVLLTSRSGAAQAAAALASDGLDVHGLDLDVTDPASVAAAAQQVRAEHGRLDALVCNAAAYVDWSETASAADLDAARGVLDTDLLGSWRTAQAFLPLLREARGRLVLVASGAGSHGDPAFGLAATGGHAASYGISKAAVLALASALAAELDGSGVLVNAVCPGLTATYEGAEAMGARPVADGARGVVWAATLPDGGPTGGFFRDGEPAPW